MLKLQDLDPKLRERIQKQIRDEDIRTGDRRAAAKPQRHPGDEPLAAAPVQKEASARFRVRVTAFRRILLDEDNQFAKFAVDCLRYAGIIPEDTPHVAKIEVMQELSEREFVRIEVWKRKNE